MSTLLIEIGAEEIPAGYIEPALKAFSAALDKKLADARIDHGKAEIFGTPRRLAVRIADVADAQQAAVTEVTGPPEKVGFDENGQPTVAGAKFAEKVGLSIEEITIKETKKGRYLCAEVKEEALSTGEVLSGALPDMIAAIPFPKTMRWGSQSVTFARPIHWIVALLDDQVIPFAYGDVNSGNQTRGHRFMSPAAIVLSDPEAYADILKKANVFADLDERRKAVAEDVTEVAQAVGGKVLPDEELVDIVKNLIEYPAVVAGTFDEAFLEVPDEVLITAMREHQKYFSVVDENNRLMSSFVVVNNTITKDMNLVATGHERVLRARLSDAKFFFEGDVKTPMSDWVEKLKKVLFQAKLGSVYDKVVRVQKMAEFLAESVSGDAAVKEKASRAAWLCKADLVSQVVIEFTKLQGVMGRIYAEKAGEAPEVASAIEEHYRPTYSGGQLPESTVGALTAIADKMDSICGCFSVGLIPTGGADPYALRRQGIGILQIMNRFGFSFSLKSLITESVALFAEKQERDAAEIEADIYEFLKNRVAHILADEGYSKDVIAAVADVSVDHVPHVWKRTEALESLKALPDFEPLAVAFKRVVNIIKKSAADQAVNDQVDESLFDDASESALWSAFGKVKIKVADALEKGDFKQALLDIASLKEAVDAFFDGVMVMAEDEKIRANRLALLKQIADLFGEFADFSVIST